MDNIDFHEYANLFPMMSAQEHAALVADMRENGYRAEYPIYILDGKILDGRNRYRAALDAEVMPRFVDYDGSNPLQFVISGNLNRRHLSEAQRAAIAGRLANMKRGGDRPSNNDGKRFDFANLQNRNEISQAEAAEMLNVSPRSVATAKVIEREAPELYEFIAGGELSLNAAANIARMPEDERTPIVNQIREGARPHVSHNSGENEWYTPREYIEAAHLVMGRIDIDPASSEIANKTVNASVYYSKNNSGLDKVWAGNIWMNPPYSSDLIGKFCDKLKTECSEGRIKNAIILVNNATETNWFYTLANICSAVVFTKGRVKFLDPDGNPGAPLQGQAILYYGDNPEKFLKEFYRFGWGATL